MIKTVIKDYRDGLPEIPKRIKALPVDERGFPVPWFVEWVNGAPDFRCIDHERWGRAVKFGNCWICGQPTGRRLAFTIGPMCMVNRTNAEPPSHYECAEFAVRACPFLTKPDMKYNEHDLPSNAKPMPGLNLRRNPGVVAIWVCEHYGLFRANGGLLIRLGDPSRVEFWREGRRATRAEVEHSIETGLPALAAVAKLQGPTAEAMLKRAADEARKYLPKE